MATVKITPSAESDLEKIFEYISESNMDSAIRLLKALGQKFDLLAENPKLGKPQDNFIVNLRTFFHKKYTIFYFPIENGVEIYRVIHGARNIEAIFEDFFEGLKP